ncbi:intermembrane transport protein PqiB [Aestuariibacter sp. A3R04]|uniref:intermembrane transport protein PqiB n=1 Tax=Aestuariibacter sp. A3R04 TaxID=2841571 RepID=UPI001C09D253|nr:intermembrane transport protein PqiB [Aestuariibacter sp. A3R04]MBU3022466.1 intermembrane transport protein PqiB [Aestuariibacter sp. A3R04]
MTQEASVKSTTHISKVWIIPIVAILIGGWMVWYQWKNQGPLITIELSSASGIEVNKTPIKVRDLEVGQVKKIELKPDLEGVLVTARIDASAARLLTENTDFWVVAPRISFSEVSGLNTLLSGSYIAMSADDSGREQFHFVALERPPATPPGTPGLHLTLKSNDKFAYKPGDPIIYKGFKVGEFEEAEFNIDERIVYYRAFIEAPYHKLITQNTRFWNVSGVKLHLKSSGVKVETGSLETLLANGVTFGIPPGAEAGPQASEEATYDIFSDDAAASNARYKLYASYLLLIDETVRGLTEGAPVEYRGIEVGEVAKINPVDLITGNILDENYPIPVLIRIYPGKVRLEDTPDSLNAVKETMHQWIKRDLRATLRMGNVLTGGLFVDLQHDKGTTPLPVKAVNGIEVIPTVSNEFTQITQKADAILDKINDLPLDRMVTDITAVITDIKGAANRVEIASGDFDALMEDIDIKTINNNLNNALVNISALLQNYAEGGLSKSEIQETVDAMQETMRNLQPLLLQLNQKPNGLIFSDNPKDDVQPRASSQGN